MTYRAIDCQGFAGGFTLGVAQAGFELVGKREMRGGFGARNCEVNRRLLRGPWQTEAIEPEAWTVPAGGANLVFGNPPCSGFSVLSSPRYRGVDSKINACMWSFAEYAARVMPQVAIFESVPLAFTQGHDLMRSLRARLEQLTGARWTLHHVLHNALSIGGPAMRKRYFWVASRVPFGVERVPPARIPAFRDVVGDLATLPESWGVQSYDRPGTWYSSRQRSASGLVDGHVAIDNPHTRRTRSLLADMDWEPGEYAQLVTRRYYDRYGKLPDGWGHIEEKLVKTDFFQGFNTPTMWNPDGHARVITGAGMLNGVHWSASRTFTHREVARVMGFPDDWLIEPLRGSPGLFLTWGKGITVDCGRWIARWAARALDGEPGSVSGEPIGDREYLIDVTNDWKFAGCGTVNTVAQKIMLKRIDPNSRRNTVTEVAETEAAAKTPGRPRPQETQERDRRVFDHLIGGKTVEAIATELGLERKLAYLSLYRLRREGLVQRARENGAHIWAKTVPAEAPADAVPAAEFIAA